RTDMEKLKTHECGSFRIEDAGKGVTVAGRVQRRRDHGGLIFVDLRDRSGIVQVVFNPQDLGPAMFAQAERLRSEYVISVRGDVRKRLEGMENPNLATGEVEIVASELAILNTAAPPPFHLDSAL